MKKKTIIMSFLLILLITISVSAISATDISTNDQDISSEDEIITEEISKDTSDKSLSDGNITISNNRKVNPTSDGTDANAIQKCINNEISNGNSIILEGNYAFEKTVNLNKDLTITGGTIYNINNLTELFHIASPSEDGPRSVTITGTTFYVNNNENIVFVKGDIIGKGITDIANITVTDCKILPINPDSDIGNTNLVKVESNNDSILTPSIISIQNNVYGGAQALNFNNVYNCSINTYYHPYIIYDTQIEANNISVYAYDKNSDTPKHLEIKLITSNGHPVANQILEIAISGKKEQVTTDENGTAKLPIKLTQTEPAYIIYLGEEGAYNPAQPVAVTIKVSKKTPSMTAKTYTYNVNAKTKKISITVKDQNNKLVVNKAVKITVNGKTYNSKTNAKGVATVTVKITKKGTYTYSAKVTCNSIYKEVSKKGKLVINGLSSAFTVKKYSFKRYATKKIKVTLKSGKTLLKYKKITLRVNGKTYSAKTNYKGVATITIKLTKRSTFTYTAKFAGDNTYKATSRSNKVVIR